MPIYEYHCDSCNKDFERYFTTIKNADPYLFSSPCTECSTLSQRICSKPPKVFFAAGYHEAPMYSDPSNRDKM